MDVKNLHVSLAHANGRIVRETAKQMGIRATGTMTHCPSCAAAKAPRRGVCPHTVPQSRQPLELLHGDLSGPMPASRGGAKYVFLILDDFSGKWWSLFLGDKSADTVARAFQAFLTSI
ncbi:unnamed protein product, partial [Hapterophycus canaliculatus]